MRTPRVVKTFAVFGFASIFAALFCPAHAEEDSTDDAPIAETLTADPPPVINLRALRPKHRVDGRIRGLSPIDRYAADSIGPQRFTFGAAPKDACSIARDARADTTAAFARPALQCAANDDTRFILGADLSYEWKSERWTAPLELTVAQKLELGPLSAQFSGGLRYRIDSDGRGSGVNDLSYRALVTFPLPH